MKRDVCKSVVLSALVLSGPLSGWGQATKTATNAPAHGSPHDPKTFQFAGGNLNLFLTKLRDQFGKDVYEAIEIRSANPDKIYVPKMRIHGAFDVRQVLMTYNQLSKEGDGFLGEWIYSPTAIVENNIGKPPDTVVFLPSKSGLGDGTGGIKVRAFSIRNIGAERLKSLRELIAEQSHRLQQEIAERSGDVSLAEGRVSIHEGTALLIASGGATYVELVATLMEALQRQKGDMF